ncbi:hypothetical protein LNKW23_16650 [Paralimibaculum aggregatum]|uniref:HTH araC/xylS-type domain-containing protein n=1 Tax=Paralimibaculum aggregatum TaxID=3036245 RepID=A0ABQ6LHI1_9RHOB|nr:helix-turn-helix domain-containing protein [Limibaculum sp. NKW23]GMG82452.1 hypothetical protein LNKW23_16650 [Limibaculum sp. NKW23]
MTARSGEGTLSLDTGAMASRSSGLLRPSTVLDSSVVEPPRRADLYRSYFSPQLPFGVDVRKPDFNVRSEDWQLPGLVLSKSRIDAYKSMWNTRRPGTGNFGMVMIRLLISGEVWGLFDGRPREMGPGDLYVMDFDCEATKFHRACAYHTLYLPHETLGCRPGQLPRFRHIRGTSPTGRMLTATVRAFAEALPLTPFAEAGELTAGLARMIGALLVDGGRDLDRSSIDAPRRAAIDAFIDDHLDDETLDAATLCRSFHMSRATLYRLFSEDGGIASHLAARRLDRIYGELARTPAGRGAVRRIAERWGYDNPTHFSRSFRRRFGIAPTDALYHAEPSGAGDPAEAGPLCADGPGDRFLTLDLRSTGVAV